MWNFLSAFDLGVSLPAAFVLEMAYPAPPTTTNLRSMSCVTASTYSAKDHRHLGAVSRPESERISGQLQSGRGRSRWLPAVPGSEPGDPVRIAITIRRRLTEWAFEAEECTPATL
jgi:hypothetical protein